eukprot:TRINITY_DN2445_c0_g2_i11.p1 TRINITY_DN2445_c0_g2~~TRINITY_DN2445_c0_g2_i11.p1  ORF type:complete len:189 (+),score=52.23 TRINITY_DN2445_c0_g2_i11:555-1121(+)
MRVNKDSMEAPAGEPAVACEGWTSNHPKCPKCGQAARPAVLMFGDSSWVRPATGANRHAWADAAAAYLGHHAATATARMLILEMGCGLRVPTIRYGVMALMQAIAEQGGRSTLVRINPSTQECVVDEEPPKNASVILLRAPAAAALTAINQALLMSHPTPPNSLPQSPSGKPLQEPSKKDNQPVAPTT